MTAIQGFLQLLDNIATAILKAFGGKASAPPAAASAPKAPGAAPSTITLATTVTADGANALAKIFGPLVDIVRGKGTLTDDEEAANAVANVLAILNPELAPAIGLIEAAEPAAVYLFGLLKTMQASGIQPITPPAETPPIAAADWSKGFPAPQPVDNPSGAIGGPDAPAPGV